MFKKSGILLRVKGTSPGPRTPLELHLRHFSRTHLSIVTSRASLKPNATILPSSSLSPYYLSSSLSSSTDSGEDPELDLNKQRRNANLGATIEIIKELVPLITAKSLPKSILSKEILLRVCPTHFEEFNAYLPAIKGHVPYYASCKLLQFLVSTIVLTPNVPLHIQSIRTSLNDKAFPYYSVYPDSTKVVVRWATSTESMHEDHSGSATLSKGWSKVATTKFLGNISEDELKSGNSISATLSDLTIQIKKLAKDKRNNLDRVVSGIFIFELNQDNDKIIVHTVEDIDILERTETDDLPSTLRVC